MTQELKSSMTQILLHPRREEGLQGSGGVGIDEAGVEMGMPAGEGLGFLQPHHHERSGIGIGREAVGRYDRGRENLV